MRFAALLVLFMSILVLAACDQHTAPPPATRPEIAPQTGVRPPSAQPAGGAAESAGIAWSAPDRWRTEGPRPMRAATYRIPAQGQGEDAELAVFYFGPGQGGDIDNNLRRWMDQFEQPGGKKSSDVAKAGKETINGLSVTTIDLTGTYIASAGPMAATRGEPKPGYRLLGAIVEAPDGNVFFKLTGPQETVAASSGEFRSLLTSLRRK